MPGKGGQSCSGGNSTVNKACSTWTQHHRAHFLKAKIFMFYAVILIRRIRVQDKLQVIVGMIHSEIFAVCEHRSQDL